MRVLTQANSVKLNRMFNNRKGQKVTSLISDN